MSYTRDQIEAAINAAELVTNVTWPKDRPVALTNDTVMALIEGAKQDTGGEREKELIDAIADAVRILQNA